MFHSFFQFSSKVEVIIFLFIFFQFYSVVSWDSKVDNFANFLFLSFVLLLLLLLLLLFTPLEFFTSVLADGFSLEFEWQQVLLSLLLLLLLLLLLFRVFHISISWWSSTGVWVTASLLKSPGLFSVFWPFNIMLLFGWSPLGRQHPNLPGPFIIL